MVKAKQGTGLFSYDQDCSSKTIMFDVSGMKNGEDYRNDASILLFMSNSYYETSKLLLQEIDNCFISKQKPKLTIRYVIPFMFCARHYIECRLKAFIVTISKESASNTHNISELIQFFDEYLSMLDYSDVNARYVKSIDYSKGLGDINQKLLSLKNNVNSFLAAESYAEYYRFLFDKHYQVNKPIIMFDYNSVNSLYNSINVDLFAIEKTLHCIGYKVFSV